MHFMHPILHLKQFLGLNRFYHIRQFFILLRHHHRESINLIKVRLLFYLFCLHQRINLVLVFLFYLFYLCMSNGSFSNQQQKSSMSHLLFQMVYMQNFRTFLWRIYLQPKHLEFLLLQFFLIKQKLNQLFFSMYLAYYHSPIVFLFQHLLQLIFFY